MKPRSFLGVILFLIMLASPVLAGETATPGIADPPPPNASTQSTTTDNNPSTVLMEILLIIMGLSGTR